MSVINKMLKDLDQQQRQRILQPNLASATLSQQGQSKRSGWWLILLLSLVLTLVIWVGLWPRLQARLAPAVQPQTDVAVSQADSLPGEATETAEAPDTIGAVGDVKASPRSEALPQAQSRPRGQAEQLADDPQETKMTAAKTEAPFTEPAGVSKPVTLDLAAAQTVGTADIEAVAVIKEARVEEIAEPQTPLTAEEPAPSTEPHAKPQVMVVAPAKLSHEQQAQALYLQGKEQGGTDALRQALALDESLHQARVLLAQRLAIADPGEALVMLAEASRRWPAEPDYALTAAEVALGSGAREQAALWLGQLNQQPLSLPMMARRADLARELSMLTLAVSDYRGLANADPQQGRWWLGLAHSLDRLGNYGEAASAYRQALSTRSLSDSARRYIEQRLQQLGDAG
ncbi:hypothetical protein [Ferrimonas futtsuensis]|uniref:hypothetical protein n=1 Tax=Ferrimonas futtsuensis TaxID=364764 RepID=UPI0003FE36BD|nr:hypothetical protein [Ferrimonas futtsuensis]